MENGRLPSSVLAAITKSVNGEQAYLRKDAAKAFMAMNAESEARFGVTLRTASARTAYRPLVDQEFFWDQYLHHGGSLAARPGTSNHGWGLAVDLATQQMRTIVDKIGSNYGWAKRWSDAQSEWWHLKWKAGVWDGKGSYGDKTIKAGQTGPTIIKLKKLLYTKGLRSFGSRYNPYFSKSTKAAVERFQKRNQLKADGEVGPATWAALRQK